MAATAAYAARRKREEDEAAAEEQDAKMRAKARARAEAEWDRASAKKNIQPRGRKLDDVTEAERLAAYKQTDRYKNYQASIQAWEQKKKNEQLHAYDNVENMRAGRTISPPIGPSWAPAEPTTFIGENPHPIAPTVPEPQINWWGGLREAAGAIDPFIPGAFTGTSTGYWPAVVELAQAATNAYPYSPVIATAELISAPFTPLVASGYSFVYDQVTKSGDYYERIQLDKTGEHMAKQWKSMTTLQKVGFVFVAGVSVLIAGAVLLTL